VKPFDLNMEEVLENWEVFHAIREVIANALDEQLISNTAEIEIYESEDKDGWHIRDYGRGIEIDHFTQNENPEKFEGPNGIIGKFGVGLKDALATFHRNGIHPIIKSAHGTYTIAMCPKGGFDDIETLHVMFDENKNDMEGTDFFLKSAIEEQIIDAKDLFLKFSNTEVIEETKYGSVLESVAEESSNRVYINGVLASEEENFLFSYNITNLTKVMRKALNRERTNVGRTTYAERVKAILKSSKSDEVMSELAEQITLRGSGEQCDEIVWTEVAQVGIRALADRNDKVIYVNTDEILNNPDETERMRLEGFTIITISDRDQEKIEEGTATTFGDYLADYNASFEFKFIEEKDLNKKEKEIFNKSQKILELVGWTNGTIPRIRISETMQNERDLTQGSMQVFSAVGLWVPHSREIIIKRDQLFSLSLYASILLHEAAHASSGASDATRAFESELTGYLGSTAKAAIDDD
jgi:hypothetical protein